MSYSSYGNQITGSLTDINSLKDSISELDLAPLWSGKAYEKQNSNLTAANTGLESQIGQLRKFADVLPKIDDYDQLTMDIESATTRRSNLNVDDDNYSSEYSRLTELINSLGEKKSSLKSTIINSLNSISNSYSQQYSKIAATEVVSTVDIFNDANEYFSKIDSGFDMSKTVVYPGNGIITEDNMYPDFSNKDAWINQNPFAGSNTGQCTWFAWGRFYEIYGYSPGFRTHGKGCAQMLLDAHPDKFYKSSTPVPGAVFSMGLNETYGHVGIVLDVDVENNKIVIQDGNKNGTSDSFAVAQNDWATTEYNLDEFCQKRGGVVFANPIGKEAVANV